MSSCARSAQNIKSTVAIGWAERWRWRAFTFFSRSFKNGSSHDAETASLQGELKRFLPKNIFLKKNFSFYEKFFSLEPTTLKRAKGLESVRSTMRYQQGWAAELFQSLRHVVSSVSATTQSLPHTHDAGTVCRKGQARLRRKFPLRHHILDAQENVACLPTRKVTITDGLRFLGATSGEPRANHDQLRIFLVYAQSVEGALHVLFQLFSQHVCNEVPALVEHWKAVMRGRQWCTSQATECGQQLEGLRRLHGMQDHIDAQEHIGKKLPSGRFVGHRWPMLAGRAAGSAFLGCDSIPCSGRFLLELAELEAISMHWSICVSSQSTIVKVLADEITSRAEESPMFYFGPALAKAAPQKSLLSFQVQRQPRIFCVVTLVLPLGCRRHGGLQNSLYDLWVFFNLSERMGCQTLCFCSYVPLPFPNFGILLTCWSICL